MPALEIINSLYQQEPFNHRHHGLFSSAPLEDWFYVVIIQKKISSSKKEVVFKKDSLILIWSSYRFTCPHCNRKFRHPTHFKEHVKKHGEVHISSHYPFYKNFFLSLLFHDFFFLPGCSVPVQLLPRLPLDPESVQEAPEGRNIIRK